METKHIDLLRSNKQTQKAKQSLDIILSIELKQQSLEIAKLPLICTKCGHVSRLKEISDFLDSVEAQNSSDYEALHDHLIQRANQILLQRQSLVQTSRQTLQQSLQQLSDLRQSLGQSLNFGDPSKYLEQVCDDILKNIQEHFEIQNTLAELNQLIQEQFQKIHFSPQDFNRLEYQDNLEVRERLESALRINLNHRALLKDFLMKIGEENKNFTVDIQLQYRQQQIETLNLLQITQDQLQLIQRLEEELSEKKNELLKYSVHIENPFKQTKLQTEDSSQFQSLQREYQSSVGNNPRVLQELKSTVQSKKNTENLCTFQSDQFYSIDQGSSPLKVQNNNSSQKSSQNSKQFETSLVNQRYGNSITSKLNQTKATSLISQLQIQNLQANPTNPQQTSVRASADTNPMASLESGEECEQNSPKIASTSRSLVTKVPVIQKKKCFVLD